MDVECESDTRFWQIFYETQTILQIRKQYCNRNNSMLRVPFEGQSKLLYDYVVIAYYISAKDGIPQQIFILFACHAIIPRKLTKIIIFS